MSGWLVSVTFEAKGGAPFLEALFASWTSDPEEALRRVSDFEPRGSLVSPRAVAELSDSMLRGLMLEPGQTGLLSADTATP